MAWTPYPEVDALLRRLLAEVRAILGSEFVGMILYGSLALDAFDPRRSDIDFVVVTEAPVEGAALAALQAMHRRLGAEPGRWPLELEGSYIPRAALRRYAPPDIHHPHIDRGAPDLTMCAHDMDWVVQRHVLREYGITLAGPPPDTLIDPVTPDALRRAMRALFDFWWLPMAEDDSHLRAEGYRMYAILTMPRILYTLEYGAVVSKQVAARWALETLPLRWAALVGSAVDWPATPLPDNVAELQAFIRYMAGLMQAPDGPGT
ncbi:MAG: DUF4111 domain-containing protein [Anaerolineae bacterium]|nr:DUF4111 domain-containing protein [Anaerolineae bacterium]